MAVESVGLKEASKIEIVSLMDNTIDFLSSNTKKEVQSFRHWSKAHGEMPFAEHGFSMLIRGFQRRRMPALSFLIQALAPTELSVNAKRMGIDLSEVAYVVLSHGHYDHFGGLSAGS